MKKEKSTFRTLFQNLSDKTRELHKTDWIVIGILVFVYGIISFVNLGSFKNPQTFYEFQSLGDEVVVGVGETAKSISNIRMYSGNIDGGNAKYDIYISNDNETYTFATSIEQTMAFSWDDFEINQDVRYLKIVSQQERSTIGEIQLYDNYGGKVVATSVNENAKAVVDEPNMVPARISYMNSAYFDEVYFARSAYEYVHGLNAMEWVHPPLGKLIQAIPVAIFGMAPFFYRLMGNLAGILMIPVMYALGKAIFKDRRYGILAALLMMFDNFHFAQSRMGTVDTFLVLFIMLSALYMFKYILLGKKDPIKKKYLYLGLSGLFVGCSIATKWTGLYAGLALAIAFFVDLSYKYLYKAKNTKKEKKELLQIIVYCVLVFVIVPVLIYFLSYLLFPNVAPGEVNSISKIFEQMKGMFQYHSTLTETHPFSSEWYTWPIMKTPVWYYAGYLGNTMRGTITGIGNPAIWWFGIIASIFTLVSALIKRDKENEYIVLFILCTWLPYMFIGRDMFMYHFFPTLPFWMLAIVSLIKFLTEKIKNNGIYVFYIAVVILFFTYFYPAVNGAPISNTYMDTLRWFSTWYF